jgi:hypothetical protein
VDMLVLQRRDGRRGQVSDLSWPCSDSRGPGSLVATPDGAAAMVGDAARLLTGWAEGSEGSIPSRSAHGTFSRYVKGCRCGGCRQARADYAKNRSSADRCMRCGMTRASADTQRVNVPRCVDRYANHKWR